MGTPWGTPRWAPCARAGVTASLCPQEFSHPVESLALTVEEMINVRRVLVKAEMEKFQQSKELYNSLKKGKVGAGAGGGRVVPLLPPPVLTLPVPAGLLLLPHQVPPLLLALSLPLLQAVSTVPCCAVLCHTVPQCWEGGGRVPRCWPCSAASPCVPRSVCTSCSLKVRDLPGSVPPAPVPVPVLVVGVTPGQRHWAWLSPPSRALGQRGHPWVLSLMPARPGR